MVSLQELLEQGVFFDPELEGHEIDPTLLDRAVEKYGDDLLVIDKRLLDALAKEQEQPPQADEMPSLNIIWSYEQPAEKRSYDDFVKALQWRFKEMERILKSRQELSMTTSLIRIRGKKEREQVATIAMVMEKSETANNNFILTVEDFSSNLKVLITQKNPELYAVAKDIQLDEIIGITGMGAGDIIFADNIIFPDVPLTKELRKSPNDEYAVFIGDPHFGSKVFLKDDYERMLLWLHGKVGNDEQRAIARKVKYVFFSGDLIEGVGIYPGQEHDLAIMDIRDQYVEAARYIDQVPKHMRAIIFTGNHDAGRLSEPQEPLMREYAQPLYDIPNVTIVSNPAMVNIGATKTFPGFDCLLYHGGSFIYYADNIPSIRAAGGQKRVDLIMKYLLQRRHLAPTHNAALTIPTTDRDWLFIDRVPDLFITGHIHRVSVSEYRGVTCVNAGCWTETTEDQVKRGLEPQPSKMVVMSLKTRQTKVMNFSKKHPAPVSRGSDTKVA